MCFFWFKSYLLRGINYDPKPWEKAQLSVEFILDLTVSLNHYNNFIKYVSFQVLIEIKGTINSY
ncbi:hypothetical protein BpHYR1_035735 [Brachionus plicatilis]|uniref:Uncharacterized protein n=1 Tax=Brachionus plicatilis TaxID=10195 RepID=A0A3M7SZ28_BRAPC|nr:hypothetical protein BpHYR1_035735 [Brachionus plicatilis]